LSLAALGRDATARLDRARPRLRPATPPHGRALRRPRRDDAGAHEHGAPAHLGGQRLDDRLRHPLDRRSGLPLDARRGHVAASRLHHRGHRHRPSAAAEYGYARARALLRARHRGARTAADGRSLGRGTARVSTTVVQPVPRSFGRMMGRRARDWLPAVAIFVLGIALWEGLVRGLHVQRFLLPAPSEILSTFWDERDTLFSAGLFTFKEAVGGFLIGSAFAIIVALVLARWRPLGNALMPYAIAANAVPIIAFAPITNNWFGILSPASKMAIAAVIVFFPVMVNTLRGLTSVRPESVELMRSYA